MTMFMLILPDSNGKTRKKQKSKNTKFKHIQTSAKVLVRTRSSVLSPKIVEKLFCKPI